MIRSKRVIAIILLYFLIFSLCLSVKADNIQVGNKDKLKENEEELLQKKFVASIYKNYSRQNFTYVYNQLYPAIKEVMSEKEYITFQKENFERYNLTISNIKVKDVRELKTVPNQFKTYLSMADIELLSSVTVNYSIFFYNDNEREIEKEVYICLKAKGKKEKKKLFLLWDPEIVE